VVTRAIFYDAEVAATEVGRSSGLDAKRHNPDITMPVVETHPAQSAVVLLNDNASTDSTSSNIRDRRKPASVLRNHLVLQVRPKQMSR
jgi:hypothetical protein